MPDAIAAEFVVEESGATTRVGVTGELDARQAQRLRELLLGTVGQPSVQKVLVDCSNVTFIDSTGLGALVYATKRAYVRDVQLVVHAPSDRVRKLLEMTGLDKVLTVEG